VGIPFEVLAGFRNRASEIKVVSGLADERLAAAGSARGLLVYNPSPLPLDIWNHHLSAKMPAKYVV